MQSITYEQPLNEKIRTFIRLEFLFQQVRHNIVGDTAWDNRATVAILVDIVNIFSRIDLKNEIIMEVERQVANLTRLDESPNVDHKILKKLLNEMDSIVDGLHALQGQIGHNLRQNEFFNVIKQRSCVAGGTCDVDLPAFHNWLQQSVDNRTSELQAWLAEFDLVRDAIELILRLIRDSASFTKEVANAGLYQQSLKSSAPCQLIRVVLADESQLFAEISGGKHRFTIRFLEQNLGKRPMQTVQNVDFTLACCVL